MCVAAMELRLSAEKFHQEFVSETVLSFDSILLVTTVGSHGRITKPCQNIDSCELNAALKSCHFLNETRLCTNTHVHLGNSTHVL